jgi:hypothetical protein
VIDGSLTPGKVCRHLANDLCAQWVDGSWKTVKHRLATAPFPDPRQPVVVLDGLVKATRPVLDLIGWLRSVKRFRIVVVAEEGLPPKDVDSVRARLLAGPALRLERLGATAAREYFDVYAARARLAWTQERIRALASATHGYPLTMCETARREQGRGVGERQRR